MWSALHQELIRSQSEAPAHPSLIPEDTAAGLWKRELAPMGLRLIEKVLWQVGGGRIVAKPQDENLATWEPAFDQVPLARFK